jgi:phosphohistidine phosphatase
MKLILMRHAIAEQRSSKYPDDSQRPLSDEGERKHRAISEVMQQMGISFDVMISSPLVRARQTAEITAKVYGGKEEIIESDTLGGEFSVPAAIKLIQAQDAASTVLCVGHEPDFSTLAAALLHSSGDVEIDFKKSGVMGLDFPDRVAQGTAVLSYFLKPGHLARLAKTGSK